MPPLSAMLRCMADRHCVRKGSAQRLSINGDDVIRALGCSQPLRPTPGKAREATAQRVRIEVVKEVGEGVVARNAVFQCHQLTHKILLYHAVFGHVGAGFVSREYTREGDDGRFVNVVTGGVVATVAGSLTNSGKIPHGSAS